MGLPSIQAIHSKVHQIERRRMRHMYDEHVCSNVKFVPENVNRKCKKSRKIRDITRHNGIVFDRLKTGGKSRSEDLKLEQALT